MALAGSKLLQCSEARFPTLIAKVPNKSDCIQPLSARSKQFILVCALGTNPPTELSCSLDLASRHIAMTFAGLEILKGSQGFVPTADGALSNHKIHILQFMIVPKVRKFRETVECHVSTIATGSQVVNL